MTQLSGRVLVVEDQDVWRQDLFSDPLRELGLTVLAASTKEEALKLLNQYRFDLAVVDINLTDVPGNTDGLVVTDYIERQGTRVPVIIVTGSKDGVRALRRKRRFIFAEIRKDLFDLKEFIARVKMALSQAE